IARKRPVQGRLALPVTLETFSPKRRSQTCPRPAATTPAGSSSGGTPCPPGRPSASPSERSAPPVVLTRPHSTPGGGNLLTGCNPRGLTLLPPPRQPSPPFVLSLTPRSKSSSRPAWSSAFPSGSIRRPSLASSLRWGDSRADPGADRPDLDLCRAAGRPQELRRASGSGPGPSGPGPAERRPVRLPQPPRGPAEDPGLAGRRLRPLLEAAGARNVRLPDRRRCRGEHHDDRAGDDPLRHRLV